MLFDIKDGPVLMPRVMTMKLKDNHISIPARIHGDIKIFVCDAGDFKEKLTIHGCYDKDIFLTLPQEWCGKDILIRYDCLMGADENRKKRKNLISDLNSLRIDVDDECQYQDQYGILRDKYERANEMLDDCIEIVRNHFDDLERSER